MAYGEISLEVLSGYDERAARMLYDAFYRALVGFAVQILGKEETAEDEVQEMFAQLWERKIVFASEGALKAYLYNGVRNRCLNHLKRLERERNRLDRLTEEHAAYQLDAKGNEPVFSEEVYRQLFLMIDEMPPRQREVFLMVMEGKKNREIAAALDISKETVRTQKKRAMAFLKKNLDTEAFSLLLLLMYPS